MDSASQGDRDGSRPRALDVGGREAVQPWQADHSWDARDLLGLSGSGDDSGGDRGQFGTSEPSSSSPWSNPSLESGRQASRAREARCECNRAGSDDRSADRSREVPTEWTSEGTTKDRSPFFWIALITGIGIWIGLAMMWGFGR